MAENDIDDLMKNALEGAVEPTYESDWINFEKTMAGRTSMSIVRTSIYLLLALVAILTISYFTWNALSRGGEIAHESQKQETENALKTTNLQAEQSKKGIVLENEREGGSEPTENDLNPKQVDTMVAEIDAKKALNSSEESNRVKNNIVDKDESVKERLSKSRTADYTATDRAGAETLEEGIFSQSAEKNASDKIQSTAGKRQEFTRAQREIPPSTSISGATPTSSDTRIAAQPTPTSRTKNRIDHTRSDASQKSEISSQTEYTKTYEPGRSEKHNVEMQPIKPLKAQIAKIDLEKHVLQNAKHFEKSHNQFFDVRFFIALEQNSVLKTSPQVGIAFGHHIQKWSVSAGVGYQRSGQLNWNRKSTSVDYGFDKYERSILLRTESISLLTLPIRTSYRVGGLSEIFIGFSPGIVIDATQYKETLNDGTTVMTNSGKGYFYKTNTPELIYFFSTGYTYSLNEYWLVDLGLKYSFQDWQNSNKKPWGGFIQFNFIID